MEQWEDFVRGRYNPSRKKEDFRDYEHATPGVRDFYRENHTRMTRDFVLTKKRDPKRKSFARVAADAAVVTRGTSGPA